MRLIITAMVQCVLLVGGQVFLKFAMNRMGDFGWTWAFFTRQLTNWPFLGCGIFYGLASVLWMYIIKNYPFSVAYPMISFSYVLAMFAAMLFFHEQIPAVRWIGVLLIMGGCCLIAK